MRRTLLLTYAFLFGVAVVACGQQGAQTIPPGSLGSAAQQDGRHLMPSPSDHKIVLRPVGIALRHRLVNPDLLPRAKPTSSACTSSYSYTFCETMTPGQTYSIPVNCFNCIAVDAPLTWTASPVPAGFATSWSNNPSSCWETTYECPTGTQAAFVVTPSLALAPNKYTIPFWFNSAVDGQSLIAALVITVVDNTPIKIFLAAAAQNGLSDLGFIPDGSKDTCVNGCVYTVNALIHQATGSYLCGNSAMAITDQIKACSNVSQITDGSQGPGDLIIVDSTDGTDAHVGICTSGGCATMNSNSSSQCTFSFTNYNFDYPGSPYTGGTVTYWRVNL